MYAYRIADARHPIFDPTGAMLRGGRWNSVGKRVIYASETYAGALLEVLVHANRTRPPKHHRSIRIVIPDEVMMETARPSDVPGWESEETNAARVYGDLWYEAQRSVLLKAPSVVTDGREFNIVFNTEHPEFTKIRAEPPEPVIWDGRLFHRAR
ncbi:MAG: RES domain-containing protein [Acidobacteriota bacterium]|nr:RES domain-containing protein [Acidobacteriota bacterium]